MMKVKMTKVSESIHSSASSSSTIGRMDHNDHAMSKRKFSPILSSSESVFEESALNRARISYTQAVVSQVLGVFPTVSSNEVLVDIENLRHKNYSSSDKLAIANNILNKSGYLINNPSSSASQSQVQKLPETVERDKHKRVHNKTEASQSATAEVKKEKRKMEENNDEDLYVEWSLYRLCNDFPLVKTSFLEFAFEIHDKSFIKTYSAVNKICKERKSLEKRPQLEGDEARQHSISNLSDWENAVQGMKLRSQPRVPGKKPDKVCLRFQREWTAVKKGNSQNLQGTSKQGDILSNFQDSKIQSLLQVNSTLGMSTSGYMSTIDMESGKDAFSSINGNVKQLQEKVHHVNTKVTNNNPSVGANIKDSNNVSTDHANHTNISASGQAIHAINNFVFPLVLQRTQANGIGSSASVPANAQNLQANHNGTFSFIPVNQPNTQANYFGYPAHLPGTFVNRQSQNILGTLKSMNKLITSQSRYLPNRNNMFPTVGHQLNLPQPIPLPILPTPGIQTSGALSLALKPVYSLPTQAILASGAPNSAFTSRYLRKNGEGSSNLKRAENDPEFQALLSTENITRKSIYPSQTFNGENNEDDNHFRLAESQFYRMTKSNSYKVIKVDLIINKKLQERYDKAKTELGSRAKEMLVFHGTDKGAIEKIIVEGFRIGGEGVQVRNGMSFGRGVYTAVSPDISFPYCKGESMLLLSLALVGTFGHDYTQGSTMDILVFQNKDYLLPRYIVHFATVY